MMVARRFLSLVAAGLLAATGAAHGEPSRATSAAGDERVRSLHAEITVLADGTLVVRETIRVRAAGRAVNHGIYRDYPTHFRSPEGTWFEVPFVLAEVLRDGKPEPWSTRKHDDGVRAYFGDPGRLLETGDHTYAITYRTERQISFLADHDELSWNVNGHGWTLPLDEVTARVLLPVPAAGVELEVRTGERGSWGREATARWEGERGAAFRATRAFLPGEALTVLLRWPKGIVREPAPPRGWWAFLLGGNRSALAGIAGLLLVLTYHLLAGRHAQRNPQRGASTGVGAPPPGLSPAGVRVLRTGVCDERTLAATLVRMAVGGYLVIVEQGGRYTLLRGAAEREVLAPEEALIADDLDLEWGRRSALEPANRSRLGAAANDLKNFLRVALERFHVLRNAEYLLPGLALSVTVLVSTLRFEPALQSFVRGLISVLLFFWTIGLCLVGAQFLHRWRDVLWRRGPQRDALFDATSISVLTVPVGIVAVAALALVTWLGSPSYSAVLLGLAFLNVRFHYRLAAPAAGSRGLLARVEHFAAWLAGSEGVATSPTDATSAAARYEEFLPYAIALDCEREWAQRWAAALWGAGTAGRRYEPAWYRAEGESGERSAAGAGVLGEGLRAAIAAALGPERGVCAPAGPMPGR